MTAVEEPYKIEEMLLFQFRIGDKAKVYAHARRTSIEIKMYSLGNLLMGIYVPPKKMIGANVYLDGVAIKNYLDFMQRLRDNGIAHWRIVYEKKYVDAFGLSQ